MENVSVLRECVDEVLRADPREMVLDLTAVTFIDSSGLATLIDTSRRAQQAGVDLGVVPGSGRVRQVLELTQLDRRLRIVD